MRFSSLLLLLFILTCCESRKHPDSATVFTPSDTLATAPEETRPVVDSAKLKMEQDGTQTQLDTPATTVPAPAPKPAAPDLPAEVKQVLNRKLPGWKLPELPELYNEIVQHSGQNPYLITGDFDGNGTTDYAVQVQQKEMVKVLAFLAGEGGKLQEYKVTELPAFKNKDRTFSVFHLTTAREGEQIFNYGTGKRLTLPRDAISVGIEYATTVYLFHEGTFIDLPAGK